jgi:hypothetical protein
MNRPTPFAGFPWGILALSALALFAGTIILKYDRLDLALGDTDDAMRLVQLRAFLHHGNWFDLHLNRIAPPQGYESHWSRIPDAIMAMIYFVVQPFTTPAFAEKAVRIIYPGLWIIPAFISIGLFAYKMSGNRLVVVTSLFLLVLNPATLTQFVAGRIDHHNAQIALAMVAVISSALQRVDWRFAIVTGISCGLMLTIGLEALPFAIVAAAAIAVNYALYDDGQKTARAFTVSFACATLAGFIVSFPPQRYLATACDALASNLTFAIVVGCAVLYAWTKSNAVKTSKMLRMVGLGVSGTAAALTYIGMDPACLSGPFGHINPAVKPIWLDRVIEMQPLLSLQSPAKLLQQLPFAYILLPALISVALLLRDKNSRSEFSFLVVLGAFAVSLPLGLLNLRMASYFSWFATPLVCVALFQLGQKLSAKAMAGVLVVAICFSPIAMTILAAKAAAYWRGDDPANQASSETCTKSNDFAFLGQQSKGLVLAELDMGPFVLALTHHDIAVAPYHRMSDRIIEVMDLFERDTVEQAHAKVLAMGAKYVVICRMQATRTNFESEGSLLSLLRQQNLPNWLAPVVDNTGGPILIFAVK